MLYGPCYCYDVNLHLFVLLLPGAFCRSAKHCNTVQSIPSAWIFKENHVTHVFYILEATCRFWVMGLPVLRLIYSWRRGSTVAWLNVSSCTGLSPPSQRWPCFQLCWWWKCGWPCLISQSWKFGWLYPSLGQMIDDYITCKALWPVQSLCMGEFGGNFTELDWHEGHLESWRRVGRPVKNPHFEL